MLVLIIFKMSFFKEKWKPVFVALIFCVGFFEFSSLPFTHSEHEVGADNNLSTLKMEDDQLITRSERFTNVEDLEKEVTRVKRHSKIMDDYDYEYYDVPRFRRRSRKKYRQNLRKKDKAKKHHHHFSKNIKFDHPSDYENKDNELSQLPGSKTNKNEWKRKTVVGSAQSRNATAIALSNPKPPLDLPIVKPEMLKVEDSKIIPTKSKPFHFHIPILSKNPEPRPNMKEMLRIAKTYKNPLTYDPDVITSAAIGQSLTVKQRASMRRIVRDSPVLDFLNLAAVLMEKRDTSKQSEADSITNKTSSEEDDLLGLKVSVVHLTATDEILQELVGDKDDLVEFQKELRDQANEQEGMGRAMTSGSGLTSDEVIAAAEDIVSSDLFKTTKSKKPKRKIKLKTISRKRRDLDTQDDEEPIHNRVKRGFGKWLKKVFGKKEKDPTTTTTEAPKKKSKKDKESSSEEKGSKKGHKKKSKSNYFVLKTDRNGDTEVDKLLPKYLRRSSYIKRHKDPNAARNKKKEDNESNEEEPETRRPGSNEEDSRENKKKKNRRTKRNVASYGPETFAPLYTYNNFNFNPGQNRYTRSLYQGNSAPVNFATSNNLVNWQSPSYPELSKGELKLVHEMLSNIIKDRCFSIDSDNLESLQSSVFNVIDRSSRPEYAYNSHPHVDTFLQQIVNCSSDAEKALKWKTQRDLTHKLTKYEEFERGSPLQRIKRIMSSSLTFPQDLLSQAQTNYTTLIDTILQMMSSIFQIVLNSCENIDVVLLHSVENILEQTFQTNVLNGLESIVISDQAVTDLNHSLKICEKYSTLEIKEIGRSSVFKPANLPYTNNNYAQNSKGPNFLWPQSSNSQDIRQQESPLWFQGEDINLNRLPLPLPLSAPPTISYYSQLQDRNNPFNGGSGSNDNLNANSPYPFYAAPQTFPAPVPNAPMTNPSNQQQFQMANNFLDTNSVRRKRNPENFVVPYWLPSYRTPVWRGMYFL